MSLFKFPARSAELEYQVQSEGCSGPPMLASVIDRLKDLKAVQGLAQSHQTRLVHAASPDAYEQLGQPVAVSLVETLADSGDMALKQILEWLSGIPTTCLVRAQCEILEYLNKDIASTLVVLHDPLVLLQTAIGHWSEMMHPLYSILKREPGFARPADNFVLLHLKRVHLMEWGRAVIAATLGTGRQVLPPLIMQKEVDSVWDQICESTVLHCGAFPH